MKNTGQTDFSIDYYTTDITDKEFSFIKDYLYETVGISLNNNKKKLITSRLAKRLRHYELRSYGEYFALATSGADPNEKQVLINLLTTNETYFFREPAHFELLKEQLSKENRGGPNYRVWSAACSSGEEAYSIAMILADKLTQRSWEVIGSDISTSVLEKAKNGHYSLDRIEGIPSDYLKKYCLKGFGPEDGTLLIDRWLRNQVQFINLNLKTSLPNLGTFDAIFLRNIMIYFDENTKEEILQRVLQLLKPGGYFFIGHSETIKGLTDVVKLVSHAAYIKLI